MNASHTSFFSAAFALAFVAGAAQAKSQASSLGDVSGLPVAWVTGGDPSALGAGEYAVIDARASAFATRCTLARVPDGPSVDVEIATRGLARAPVAAGARIATTTLPAGVVLSAQGEAIAFIPNRLGRALIRDARAAA